MMKTNEQIAMRISWNTIIANSVLSALKLFAGIFANSGAMLSDAVHTLSDVLSTVIVMAGIKLANRRSDKEHPYGHERMECVAAIILSAVLFATGIGIGFQGAEKIAAGDYGGLAVPGAAALAVAVLSIAAKEAMYWYTKAAAKKISSGALMADAWHHRSDALSSIGSFIGILGARSGIPVLDPLASVVICLFIIRAAFSIFMDSIGKMTDRSCDDEVIEKIREVILSQRGVVRVDQIKTRLFGDKIYVDVEVGADGESTLYKTHEVAHSIHDAIESQIPGVKHCMVHMNPADIAEKDG